MKQVNLVLLLIIFLNSIAKGQNFREIKPARVKRALEYVRYTYDIDSANMHIGIEMEYYLEVLDIKFSRVLINKAKDSIYLIGNVKSSDINYKLSPITVSIWTCDLLANKDLHLNQKIYVTDSLGNFDFKLSTKDIEKIYFLYDHPQNHILPSSLNIKALLK
ncbi:hypothetical protein [Ferruginibacter sp.]